MILEHFTCETITEIEYNGPIPIALIFTLGLPDKYKKAIFNFFCLMASQKQKTF